MGDPSNTRRSRDSAPPSQAMPPHNHMHSHVHRHDRSRGISKQPLGTGLPRHVHDALARYEKDVPKATYTAAGLWRMRTAAFKASAEASKAQTAKPKPPVPMWTTEPAVPPAATRFRLGERVTLSGMDLVQYNGQSGVIQSMEGSKIVLKFDSGKVARCCSSKASPLVTPSQTTHEDMADPDDEWMSSFGDEALDIFAGTLDGEGIDLTDQISSDDITLTDPAPTTKIRSTPAHLGEHFAQAVKRPGKACRIDMSTTHEPTRPEQLASGSTNSGDLLDQSIDGLLNDWFDGEFSSDCLQITA